LENRPRNVPMSDLDLQMQMTEPQWGKEVPPELKERLTKVYGHLDETGQLVVTGKEALWELLGFYTKDMRLANVNDTQLEYCKYYIDLAGDALREGYISSFMTALSRAVTVLELSQSRAGFLRNRTNTITSENVNATVNSNLPKNAFGGLRGGKL